MPRLTSEWMVTIYGAGEHGKSYLARKLLAAELGPGRIGLYATPNRAETDPLDLGVDRDGEPIAADMTCAEVRACARLPYAVALRAQERDDVCALALELAAKYRVILCVDEAQLWFPNGFENRRTAQGEVPPAVDLFTRNRHIPIKLFLVARYPSGLTKLALRSGDRVIWFHLSHKPDLKMLKEQYSLRAAVQVRDLPPRKYVEVERDNLPPAWRPDPEEL